MTTAVIGTGGIGSAVARLLGAGGEAVRLSSRDVQSARALAADIGPSAAVAADNRAALDGADAVVLALRFSALQGVIEEIGTFLADRVVVVPSNPLTTDAQGNVVRVLADGETSGLVIAGWLPARARLAMAFGTMSATLLESSRARAPERAVLFYATDDAQAGVGVERLIRLAGFEPLQAGGLDQSSRLEVGGDLHDVVIGPTGAAALVGRT